MKQLLYIFLVFTTLSSVQAQEQEVLELSLKEAIDYAIKNNYNNKVALNDIEAAKKRKWETTTIGLPQINGKVDYQNWIEQQVTVLPAEFTGGQPGTFIAVPFGTEQSANASVTLNQLIFDGSYLVGLQSAKTYLKISEQAKEKTELATREAVINAYGNILIAEERIEILKRNRQVIDRQLRAAKLGYENGLTDLETVEQFEITQGSIESQQRNATRNKEIAYQMFNFSLGNPINKKVVLKETLEDLLLANSDLQLLVEDFVLGNHIDFRIAQNNRESNRLLLKLEKSKALPSLSAFINYGANANSNSFSFFDSDQKWYDYSLFGVSLNVPIFSSLGRSAKTQQARIALETADIRLEETKQRLNLAAQQAKSNFQLSVENYETAKKNLGLAERIEKKQKIKFDEGVTTSFDLLQARNQLYAQQNNYLQSILNIIATKAQLENALNIPVK